MKPLRIELAAFGPFSSRETIDFSEIEGASLLLIHGPTGSGKTTILDAMCYALFGDTSGAEREGKQMRCDSAEPDLRTCVRYEFALGAKRYCVERRPEQLRPAKRGGGMSTDSHQATLWDRSSATSAKDEGKLMASGAAKVKKAVSDLIGFESEQFRQVVILPQGQFRKLLIAESKEKEKILQRLFQTVHYSKLERALASRASELRRRFEDDQVAMATLLGQEDVETIEELSARIAEAAATYAVAVAALPLGKKSSEEAYEALARGKKDDECLREAAAAQLAVQNLAKGDEEVERLRSSRSLARKAVPLVARADALQARAREAEDADKERAAAEEQLRLSTHNKRAAAEALDKEKARSGEREQGERERARLETMTESVQRLDEVRAKLAAARAAEGVLGQKSEAAVCALEVSKSRLEADQKELDEHARKAARAEALALALQQSQASFERRKVLDTLQVECDTARASHESAEDLLAQRRNELGSKERELEKLERAWQEGQAGALARDLADGNACPVCGSEKHPSLAPAPDSLPSEEELEQGRQALRVSREATSAARDSESSARANRSSKQAQHTSLREELGVAAQRSLEEWSVEVALEVVALDAALAAGKAVLSVGSTITRAEVKLKKAQEHAAVLADELDQARMERSALVGSVTELEEKVPPDLRQPGALAAAASQVAQKLETLEKALQAAQTAASEADQGFATCEANMIATQSAAVVARIKAGEILEDFELRCADAGFAEPGTFATAQALVAQIPDFDARIKKHEGEVKAAADRLERATLAAEGTHKPNLEELHMAATQAQAQLIESNRVEEGARNRLEHLKKIHSEHEVIRIKVATQEEQWRIVSSVSELANGKVPPKVSFQRFVLAGMFDEVLLAATERLARMSKGRYRLQRQSESRHKGRASGLDLEVLDTYTGAPRSASTLSGGESFLAALALSLGLADVVQRFSGGIRLDTLLVDEGFGTLDSNALDLALDTLIELTAEGRLVGIISHVDELKSRIATRLEVQTGDHGSSTRFVGG